MWGGGVNVRRMRAIFRRISFAFVAIAAIGLQRLWNAIRWLLNIAGIGQLPHDLGGLWDLLPVIDGETGRWILGGIGFVGFVVAESAPYIRKWIKPPPALEILYDPIDPEGRYGGVGRWYPYQSDDEPVMAFIFRIGVQNNTRKTIYDVTGTVEGGLVDEPYPIALRFSRTREFGGNLDPGRMLLMDVFAMSQPEPANWPEGVHQLVVRVNGRDTPEAMRSFYFDKSRLPSLYLADS